MRIPIEVEVVMDKCNECPRLEIETQKIMGVMCARCKHIQLCRTIISIWEEAHPKKEGE